MRSSVTLMLAVPLVVAAACTASTEEATGTSGTPSTSSSGGGGQGGAGEGGATSSSTTSSGFPEAPHAAQPQVVSLGGQVLKTPKAMIISYASDPMGAEVDKLVGELEASGYWKDTTFEYGVGPLSAATPVHRPEAIPASLNDATLLADLKANLTGASPAWGAADKETIYLFLIPKGTKFGGGGGACCQDFDGFHDQTNVGGNKQVVWGVVCECPGFDGPQITDPDQVGVATSHELVEAATDPYFQSAPGYAQTDDASVAFTIATGGELADLCEFDDDQYLKLPGVSHTVQRSWSNAAAASGHEPCVPAPKEPYFNAAPVMNDDITLQFFGPVNTKGVKIPLGQSKTIDVQLFSDGPTGDWTVQADDVSTFYGGPPTLKLALDKTSGKNGDVLKLTITALKKDAQFGGEIFALTSRLNGASSIWFGGVGN